MPWDFGGQQDDFGKIWRLASNRPITSKTHLRRGLNGMMWLGSLNNIVGTWQNRLPKFGRPLQIVEVDKASKMLSKTQASAPLLFLLCVGSSCTYIIACPERSA